MAQSSRHTHTASHSAQHTQSLLQAHMFTSTPPTRRRALGSPLFASWWERHREGMEALSSPPPPAQGYSELDQEAGKELACGGGLSAAAPEEGSRGRHWLP
ncbi:hypothetical protein KIL84_000924 [Mauremys mutica]|uniref:Uncharacterized protein n=1 Tax=Mauremys mutica TaxID=74926 RepID=A0A9D3WXK1_9SAUR|nr:hypothetical protein KIL84_000924 [Mauremys mutica]